ncbi:UNVERIFIED_CONTAM: hypothetical protein K2H54_026982 [Gekko kuhli]
MGELLGIKYYILLPSWNGYTVKSQGTSVKSYDFKCTLQKVRRKPSSVLFGHYCKMLVYSSFWICAHEGFYVFATLQVRSLLARD